MTARPSIIGIIAWALVGACWLWLFRSSHRRKALMKKLAEEYSGFIRSRFFLPTLALEPVDLAWSRVFAGEPVLMSIRYELPLVGLSSLPQTIFEFETREARFGSGGGSYTGIDLLAGRGLFLGGVNLTEKFRKFSLVTPHSARFRLGWKGPRVWLAVPGLLDSREEVWVRHCTGFMEELAAQVLGAPPGPAIPVNSAA